MYLGSLTNTILKWTFQNPFILHRLPTHSHTIFSFCEQRYLLDTIPKEQYSTILQRPPAHPRPTLFPFANKAILWPRPKRANPPILQRPPTCPNLYFSLYQQIYLHDLRGHVELQPPWPPADRITVGLQSKIL